MRARHELQVQPIPWIFANGLKYGKTVGCQKPPNKFPKGSPADGVYKWQAKLSAPGSLRHEMRDSPMGLVHYWLLFDMTGTLGHGRIIRARNQQVGRWSSYRVSNPFILSSFLPSLNVLSSSGSAPTCRFLLRRWQQRGGTGPSSRRQDDSTMMKKNSDFGAPKLHSKSAPSRLASRGATSFSPFQTAPLQRMGQL